nr:MAG TPA: hypothetical protein [Caudoviricetes sp.]
MAADEQWRRGIYKPLRRGKGINLHLYLAQA